MEDQANSITINRDEYFELVSLSERRRQAIAEAFKSIENLKQLKFKIDLTKKPKTIVEKLQFNTNLVREIGALLSDEEKQQLIVKALGNFTNKEYLEELKTLSQDE